METTLRAYNRAGTRLGVLPWSTLTRTIVRNAAGALTAQVPRSLLDPLLLGEEVYLRVAVNGVEADDWYLLDDDGDDDTDAGGDARPVAIGASGVASILEWGTVYSWEYEPHNEDALAARVLAAQQQLQVAEDALFAAVRTRDRVKADPNSTAAQITDAETAAQTASTNRDVARKDLARAMEAQTHPGNLLGLDPTYGFAAATPGHILATLIEAAKDRGCFPHLTYSFTGDVDSAGQPWPATYARTYDLGTTIGKVLQGMTDDAWLDWEMRGFRLDVYLPDTVLAEDLPDSIVRLGQSATAAPRKRSRKTSRSVILANGAEGATVEITDPDALARLGRREAYEGRNGITDVGTLTAATQVSLSRQVRASEAVTIEMFAGEAPPLPRPGGYIRYDQRRLSPTQLEPMRVQSIAWDYGDPRKVSVELADLWVDRDVKLQRKVDALLNGSSANERVPLKESGDDHIPPGPVAGLAAISDAYVDTNGQLQAQVTATWVEVTFDADGTAIDDLLGYDIEWRQPDVSDGIYRRRTRVVTREQWSPVVANTNLELRIRAVDRYENAGDWSDWLVIVTGRDQTAPPRPSNPTGGNYLGLLQVHWDGKFVGNAPRPADFSHVEVHVSALSGFTPDDTTVVGSMSSEGSIFRDAPYGQPRFVRLVSVDFSGNKDGFSDQVQITTGPVVAADIFDGAVGSAKLADLAVKTAKIDIAAVNTAQVGSIDVGRIIAGTITAQWIMGGRIVTADPGVNGTAARVELNGRGIYRWDGVSASPVVAIDDTGALLTGIYRTALSGRRIEMGAAGREGRIDFFSPGAYAGFVRSYTENGTLGTEAIQFGMQVPGNGSTLWNRINYNASPNGEYATYKSGTHEFTFDTSFPNTGGRFVVYSGTNRDTGPNMYRMQIDGTSHTFNNVATGMYRFYWDTSLQSVDFLLGAGAASAPMFRLNVGNGWGGGLKFYGDSVAQRFEFRWGGDDGFYAVWAQAFVVQSDAGGKDEIAAADHAGMLAAVRATPVSTYRRKLPPPPGDTRRRAAALGPVEVGLVAQHAPAQLLAGRNTEGGLTIDLYQMASTTWGATAELAGLVDALRGELDGLRNRVATLTGDTPG